MSKDGSIRLLLVDDSPLALASLKRVVAEDTAIEVVGTASDGEEALGKVKDLLPDVICTDLYMPRMNGLELTRSVMEAHPTPILVVSAGVSDVDGENIFELLQAGALDVLPKPKNLAGEDFQKISKALLQKIKILSRVKVFKRKREKASSKPQNSQKETKSTGASIPEIVIIGLSTGGPQTLERVLKYLSPEMPFATVCVQHIGEEFIEAMVQWLDRALAVDVRFAEHGKIPEAGVVYFPPAGGQLEFLSDGSFDCRRNDTFNDFLPSVDVTFFSAARSFQAGVLACIMTGMGEDGKDGMGSIQRAGGRTIAQTGSTCVIDGMPRAAREAGVISEELSPEEIGELLAKFK